jgi:predicted cobalt transporter CbtA
MLSYVNLAARGLLMLVGVGSIVMMKLAPELGIPPPNPQMDVIALSEEWVQVSK